MSSRPQENSPWPVQTPAPVPRSPKRRRISDESARFAAAASLATRQFQDQIAQAETQCENLSGNDVESCFPTADVVYAQHEFATFVWNSRLPQYLQTNLVNVFLFHGDTNEQINAWFNLSNSKLQPGVVSYQVNDTWWGDNGSKWDGTNTSYPFYFVITPNTKSLDGSQSTQPHFTAVQTTFADSVVSSMSASSASAASASSASVASASRASASSAAEHASSSGSSSGSSAGSASAGSPTGSIQSGADSNGFPHWAIAVIVVLGFLAIASCCLLAFFIVRRLRRRRELNSNRNSMGSASPMMAHVQSPGSPLLAATGGLNDPQSSVGHDGQIAGGAGLQRAPSAVSPDGASSISHGGSAGEGPFSGADAAIMADAFRKALRKPDFAGTVEEGESPDSQERGRDEALLSRELAEEGRDIRSVSSSRGVRVETLSDSGDTVQE